MKTSQMLGTATAANAQSRIMVARERGWSDELIRKHGTKEVKRLLKSGVEQPVAEYAPRPSIAAQLPPRTDRQEPVVKEPVSFATAQRFAVNFLRDGTRYAGEAQVLPARPARNRSGSTHDVLYTASINGVPVRKQATLSELSFTRLQGGERVYVWLPVGGEDHSFVLTLADEQ